MNHTQGIIYIDLGRYVIQGRMFRSILKYNLYRRARGCPAGMGCVKMRGADSVSAALVPYQLLEIPVKKHICLQDPLESF